MKLKALVIDDSRVMRNMVMQSLNQTKMADFDFVEAADGADALAKFDPREIHIAFVDWNMPTMTGVDFVRKVRSLGGTEHIPLVMVTSERKMGKVEEALDEAGADAYICKPFTAEELEHKLRKHINKIGIHLLRQQREMRQQEQQKGSSGLLGSLFG